MTGASDSVLTQFSPVPDVGLTLVGQSHRRQHK